MFYIFGGFQRQAGCCAVCVSFAANSPATCVAASCHCYTETSFRVAALGCLAVPFANQHAQLHVASRSHRFAALLWR